MSASSAPSPRELDRLIASKVMGVTKPDWCDQCCSYASCCSCRSGAWGPLPYSTHLDFAFLVIDKIGPVWRGFTFMLDWCEATKDWRAGWFEWGNDGPEGRATGQAPDPEMAICLAALEVVRS